MNSLREWSAAGVPIARVGGPEQVSEAVAGLGVTGASGVIVVVGGADRMQGKAAVRGLFDRAVTVVADGGPVTVADLEAGVARGRPVVVLDGTGRTADRVAAAQRIATGNSRSGDAELVGSAPDTAARVAALGRSRLVTDVAVSGAPQGHVPGRAQRLTRAPDPRDHLNAARVGGTGPAPVARLAESIRKRSPAAAATPTPTRSADKPLSLEPDGPAAGL